MQDSEIVKRQPMAIAAPVPTTGLPIPFWLRGRRGLIGGGIVVVAAGLFLGWDWLSAIGVAPIILALAPCAAMCAAGMCAMKACSPGAKSDATKSAGAESMTEHSSEPPR